MIKFSSVEENGRRRIYLGLSTENIKRLEEGKPILFAADELGFDGEIVIFTGATEERMKADLKNAGVLLDLN